jgi:hypothetical protein
MIKECDTYFLNGWCTNIRKMSINSSLLGASERHLGVSLILFLLQVLRWLEIEVAGGSKAIVRPNKLDLWPYLHDFASPFRASAIFVGKMV